MIAVIPLELKNRLKNFITDRSGLYFRDHEIKNLEEAISLRMKIYGFESPVTYYNYLTTGEKKEDEFRELLNILTVNHTYFFRDTAHFNILKNKILPELINKKSANCKNEKPVIKIWSAGCSTGEEPYTIAMLIKELLGSREDIQIKIIATDASLNALEKARKGVYRDSAVKYMNEFYLKNYFTVKNDAAGNEIYEIIDEIKNMVDFSYFNLMDDIYPKEFDMIFCRNVVIYFEFQTIVNVMTKIHSSLLDDAYLFIGYSESLNFMRDKFSMVIDNDALYYKKFNTTKNTVNKTIEKISDSFSKIFNDLNIHPKITDAKPHDKKTYETKENEWSLDFRPKAPEISDTGYYDETRKTSNLSYPIYQNTQEMLGLAKNHIAEKEYNKATNLLEEILKKEKNSVEALPLLVEILINQGKMELARQKLSLLYAINPLFPPAYYFSGCIHVEEGKIDKAKENFRKALYLDKNFLIARIYLAHIYREKGDFNEAIKEYRNTLKVLSLEPAEKIVPYSGGFSVSAIMGICRDNLERLKNTI
ncbi:MCP methyltransferase, CheR-type [Candidatus Omnitrophus magneticus]|uniref:protein-glutamate O-methyltransferase n=1 Tax=Candidatus Omnitrophus magneticus TaxID=1609969 RepID=A0A0F0CV90_9BACT|nr:MCP methyltransferase, CheR-type [Candidatus Omnitrophus magneticus]